MPGLANLARSQRPRKPLQASQEQSLNIRRENRLPPPLLVVPLASGFCEHSPPFLLFSFSRVLPTERLLFLRRSPKPLLPWSVPRFPFLRSYPLLPFACRIFLFESFFFRFSSLAPPRINELAA